MRNWSSASSVKFAAKSTANQYIAGLLRCMVAVGLKRLRHAALGVRRGVHRFGQQQTAQLGKAVKVALRKNIDVLHHDIRWTSGLKS
jgi:hypothetical protein